MHFHSLLPVASIWAPGQNWFLPILLLSDIPVIYLKYNYENSHCLRISLMLTHVYPTQKGIGVVQVSFSCLFNALYSVSLFTFSVQQDMTRNLQIFQILKGCIQGYSFNQNFTIVHFPCKWDVQILCSSQFYFYPEPVYSTDFAQRAVKQITINAHTSLGLQFANNHSEPGMPLSYRFCKTWLEFGSLVSVE